MMMISMKNEGKKRWELRCDSCNFFAVRSSMVKVFNQKKKIKTSEIKKTKGSKLKNEPPGNGVWYWVVKTKMLSGKHD